MLGTALREDLKLLIEQRDWDSLREGLSELDPADGAEILAELPPRETGILFRILPRGQAADIFEQLPLEAQSELVESLSDEQVESILNEMAPDDRTRLLEELPARVTQRALETLHPDQLKVARRLLGYPERSAGRVMTPEYVALSPETTAGQAIEEIRRRARKAETLDVIYVVDSEGRLVDDMPLSRLVLAAPDTPLSKLGDGTAPFVPANVDQDEVVRRFEKYDRVALPVTDSRGVLVGIITADDVLDVARREATEDIQKLGGSEALDAPYLELSPVEIFRKRGIWLSILLVMQMFTATAMAHFEDEIAKAVVLALFVPLIISSGGNSGSQATSIIIRALALGEVGLRSWWQVARREVISGLLLGTLLGFIGFLRIVLWPWRDEVYGPHWMPLAVTIGVSLVGVVLYGTLVGSMLPLLLKRIGLDPAAASAPFVATLVDVTGLVLYFTVASIVLHGTLL